LFVCNSQVIGSEGSLRNDLYCVGWGIKLYSIQSIGQRSFRSSAPSVWNDLLSELKNSDISRWGFKFSLTSWPFERTYRCLCKILFKKCYV